MQTTPHAVAEPVRNTAADDEPIEAEFVEASAIRRTPAGAQQRATARISMDLEKWLEVDHQLHELYNLVEIAILQRDDARASGAQLETTNELLISRLREWKAYARGLETRLHAQQIENLEMSFALKRTAEVAEEALAAPRFARSRRRELRERLLEIGDSLG